MALQFALNRLFVVTANMGTLFEKVSFVGIGLPVGKAQRRVVRAENCRLHVNHAYMF